MHRNAFVLLLGGYNSEFKSTLFLIALITENTLILGALNYGYERHSCQGHIQLIVPYLIYLCHFLLVSL